MRNRRSRFIVLAASVGLSGLTGCQTWVGGMTLPTGHYLKHTPQYFSPDPAFPLPRELASMEDPVGAAARQGGVGISAAPALQAPSQPVPAGAGPGGGAALPY